MDISVHRVNSRSGCDIEIVHPPTGNNCGGSRVNKKLQTSLKNLLVIKDFPQTGSDMKNAKHMADLNMLIKTLLRSRRPSLAARKQLQEKWLFDCHTHS